MGEIFGGRVLCEAHVLYQHPQRPAMSLRNLLSLQMPVRNEFQNNGNLRGVMVTANLASAPSRIAQSFWDMFWQLAGLFWSFRKGMMFLPLPLAEYSAVKYDSLSRPSLLRTPFFSWPTFVVLCPFVQSQMKPLREELALWGLTFKDHFHLLNSLLFI